jgi:hypothetical protein
MQTIATTKSHTRIQKVPKPDGPLVLPAGKGILHMKSYALVLAVFYLVTSAVAFTGCVNSSTLQTAKALDPGKQRILVGGGF